ncbi:MAG: 50S ribosomal protein L25/general stress protein Ctc [Chromatiales bacterium]|jgi:large subunit ribosomal protein L25
MSASFIVNAEFRSDQGKGASRRLRQTGRLPGILYGAHKEPTMISLTHNEIVRHLDDEAFYSNLLTLNLGGNQETVVLKDLQRHPSKPFILHADFQRVQADEKIRLHVPLHFVNEAKCPGVKAGGKVSHQLTDIEITCLPKDLPEYIEVDMSEMQVGDALHLSQLKLPDGVEYPSTEGEDYIVVNIHTGHGGDEEEEGEEGAPTSE